MWLHIYVYSSYNPFKSCVQACREVKRLMLHMQNCSGVTLAGQPCPFPWCRPCQPLLHVFRTESVPSPSVSPCTCKNCCAYNVKEPHWFSLRTYVLPKQRPSLKSSVSKKHCMQQKYRWFFLVPLSFYILTNTGRNPAGPISPFRRPSLLWRQIKERYHGFRRQLHACLLYTSDAADE